MAKLQPFQEFRGARQELERVHNVNLDAADALTHNSTHGAWHHQMLRVGKRTVFCWKMLFNKDQFLYVVSVFFNVSLQPAEADLLPFLLSANPSCNLLQFHPVGAQSRRAKSH